MILVSVRVHPGASREALELLADGTLDARLRTRPIEGRANEALVRLLATRLGLRAREVRIAGGTRARQKLVEVDLPSVADLSARLGTGDRGGDG